MFDCPICGADYSVQGLDAGRCRSCGGVVAWQEDPLDEASPDGTGPGANQPSSDPADAPDDAAGGDSGFPVMREDLPDNAVPPNLLGPATKSSEMDEAVEKAGFPREAPHPGEHVQADDDAGTDAADQTPQANVGRSLTDSEMQRLDGIWKKTYEPHTRPGATLQQTARPGVDTKLVIQNRNVGGLTDNIVAGQTDYETLQVLGQGGVGVVYIARQSSIDRNVAVKMLRPELRHDADQRQKFLSEAVVTGELEHPNIVPIYDLGRNQTGELFYSMKFARGTPWSELLTSMSVQENLDVLQKVSDAIAFAHSKSVIHRDIKPENVMLGDFGEVLVLDWGIAVSTSSEFKSGLLGDTSLGGTPVYMAPEMATGPASKIGMRSDVYLLGAVLFEILTHEPPHSGSDVRACLRAAAENQIRVTTVTGELMDVARKAMATDPDRRYSNVLEFQQAIRDYQSHSESIRISNDARDSLEQAKESGDYDSYAQAIYGFNEALKLWTDNARAEEGGVEARMAYARSAFKKGDFDLGISLLSDENPKHQPLLERLRAGRKDRDNRHQRVKTLRNSVAALVLLMLVSAAGAVVMFSNQAAELRVTEKDANKKKDEAESQKRKAELAKRDADDSAARAKAAATTAERLRMEATKAQARANMSADQARQQEALAHLNAYRLAVGLAPQQLVQNAFGEARATLAGEQDSVRRKLRHFEWGRLQYLATMLDTEYGTSVDGFTDGVPIACVACVPDGSAIAAGSPNGELLIWKRNGDEFERRVVQVGESIQAIAVAPNAKLLAAAVGDQGRVWLWSLADGAMDDEPLAKFQPHQGQVQRISFSPDQLAILTCSDDRTAAIWDVSNGNLRRTFRGHLGPVNDARFSPDGNWVVTASDDATVRVWQVPVDAPAAELDRFQGHSGPVFAAAFDPAGVADGAMRIVSGSDQQLIGWRTNAPRVVAIASQLNMQPRDAFLQGLVHAIGKNSSSAVSTTPVSKLPASLEAIVNWNREQVTFAGHGSAVLDVSFTGGLLISAGQDNTIRVWDAAPPEAMEEADATSDRLIKTLAGHGSSVSSICLPSEFPDEIISGSLDRTVRRWSLSNYERVRRYGAEDVSSATASAFSADGNLLVIGHQDGVARLYDAANRKQLALLDEGHDYLAYNAIYYDGGAKVVTIGGDNRAVAWDVRRGTEIGRLENTGYRGVAAISTDQRTLATGSAEKTAVLWDLEQGTRVAELLVAEQDQKKRQLTRVTDQRDDESKSSYEARIQQRLPDISSMSFSPDGSLVVVGDTSGNCWICDAATGKTLGQFQGHRQAVNSVVFFQEQDGAPVLMTAGDDQFAVAWQLEVKDDTAVAVEVPNTRMVHPKPVLMLKTATNSKGSTSIFTVCSQPRTNPTAPNARRDPRVMQVRYWKWGDLSKEANLLSIQADRVNSIDIEQRDGEQMLLLACFQGTETTLREWNPELSTAPLLWSDNKSRGLITSSLFDPAGVLTVGGSGARRWTRALGQRVLSFRPHRGITAVGFFPPELTIDRDDDGILFRERGPDDAAKTLLYTASVDGSVKIWEAGGDGSTQRAKAIWRLEGVPSEDPTLRGHRGAIHSASVFVRDGQPWLLTGSADGTAKLWRQDSGRQWIVERTFAGHAGAVRKALLLPDGRSLLTVSDDRRGLIWSLDADSPPREIVSEPQQGVGHEGPILCAAASSDGRWVATGGGDRTIHLWDISGQGPVRHAAKLEGHSQRVNDVAFSSDRRRLLSVGADDRFQIWDVDPLSSNLGSASDTIEVLLSMSDHKSGVTSISISHDGRLIVTTGADGMALGWDAVSITPSLLVTGSYLTYDVGSTKSVPVAQQAVVSAPTRFDFDGHQLVVKMSDPEGKWDEQLRIGVADDSVVTLQDATLLCRAVGSSEAVVVGELVNVETDRLEIGLNANATSYTVESILRAIQYQCRAELEADATRTVEFSLVDDNGQMIGNSAPEQRLIYLKVPASSGSNADTDVSADR